MKTESISIEDAVASRFSCRAFLPQAVPAATIRALLERAARAASGSNIQPWRVDVLTGQARDALVDDIAARLDSEPRGEPAEYHVHPPGLAGDYQTRRFAVGEQLYAALGIPRADKPARFAQFHRNFAFFGAPVALFLSVDRIMGPPQWADLGMFAQTLMLLARGQGLHTCAQESWAMWPQTVGQHLGLPANMMVFCAIALGFADLQAPVNQWRSSRASVDEFAHFHGD